jgi:hypothetical protein
MNTNKDFILEKIKFSIPAQILDMAFKPKPRFNNVAVTMEHNLYTTVLQKRVLQDCNMVTPTEKIINIQGATAITAPNGVIIKIGMEATGGKNIMSVLSVGFWPSITTRTGPTVSSSYSPMAITSDAQIELIAENTIFIPGYRFIPVYTLRCALENAANFSNIKHAALNTLAEMCLLATKAYIYNNLLIAVGTGQIIQGIDITTIKATIEGYSDSLAMYNEMLTTTWKKVHVLSDPIAKQAFVRCLIPK